jgi:hypothetical protein
LLTTAMPTCTGSCSSPAASVRISGGIVAENIRFCRRAGNAWMMRLHIGQEPHVEHVVGLVEHEHLDLTQVDELAAHQVEQAPRRRHQNIDPAPELADLRALRHAAEDHRVPDVLQKFPVGREALADLRRQLAGRRQHQRADLRVVARARVEPLQHRQRERRRLAGARLGAPDDVAARQSRPDRLALDRRRLDVPGLGDGP